MSALFEVALGAWNFPIAQQFVSKEGKPLDFSGATTTQFYLTRPDGTILVKPAFFTGDGSLGILFWIPSQGDLSVTGTWKQTAFVQKPDYTSFSRTYEFFVFATP